MHFPVDLNKAIQAIGVLFREDGVKRMNYMRVLKLLYIADRQALAETARPITGGPVVAMARGPVLQEVYDLIRGRHLGMPMWDSYLRKDRYALEVVSDPDVGRLSKYEISKLQEVAKRHAEDDEWELSRLSHEFPEWIKNSRDSSSQVISLQDTLEAVGTGDATGRILEEAQELTRVRALLGR
jgi:uncharacterized phage-associated protein